MATEKQIAANRLNGLKGGVKTPEGKAISRLNARKHGIFASVLTEHDADELRGLLDELIADLKPVGILEQLLVDKLAVTYLRMRRCAKAETVYYRDQWNSSSGRPGHFRYSDTVVNLGLYDARLTHQFLRLLHEIEWRRKARIQEGARYLPHPPASVTPLNPPPAPELCDPVLALRLVRRSPPAFAGRDEGGSPCPPKPWRRRIGEGGLPSEVPRSGTKEGPPSVASAKEGPALEARNQGAPLPQVKNEPNLSQLAAVTSITSASWRDDPLRAGNAPEPREGRP